MVAIAVQVLTVLVILLADIGFDKPGRFGLDFGHLLLLLAVWLTSSCIGFVLAWRATQRWPLGLQALLLLVVLAGGLILALGQGDRASTAPAELRERPRGG